MLVPMIRVATVNSEIVVKYSLSVIFLKISIFKFKLK